MGFKMDRPEGFGKAPPAKSGDKRKPKRTGRPRSGGSKAPRAKPKVKKAEFGSPPAETRLSRTRAAVAISSILAVGLVAVLVVVSPLLQTKEIHLEGNAQLSKSDLEPLFENLYGVPLGLITDEIIAEALAPVSMIQAFDTRIAPPNTLVLRIVERKPLGVFYAGGSFEVVDAAGVVLANPIDPPDTLPQILVQPDPKSSSFRAVTRVLAALPDQLLKQVNAITASTLDDVRFTVRESSHEVVWGSSERSVEKAGVLRASLVALDGFDSRIIDVSTPESVVVREQ